MTTIPEDQNYNTIHPANNDYYGHNANANAYGTRSTNVYYHPYNYHHHSEETLSSKLSSSVENASTWKSTSSSIVVAVLVILVFQFRHSILKKIYSFLVRIQQVWTNLQEDYDDDDDYVHSDNNVSPLPYIPANYNDDGEVWDDDGTTTISYQLLSFLFEWMLPIKDYVHHTVVLPILNSGWYLHHALLQRTNLFRFSYNNNNNPFIANNNYNINNQSSMIPTPISDNNNNNHARIHSNNNQSNQNNHSTNNDGLNSSSSKTEIKSKSEQQQLPKRTSYLWGGKRNNNNNNVIKNSFSSFSSLPQLEEVLLVETTSSTTTTSYPSSSSSNATFHQNNNKAFHDEKKYCDDGTPQQKQQTSSQGLYKYCTTNPQYNTDIPPAFESDTDYPPGWLVYHPIHGIITKEEADQCQKQ